VPANVTLATQVNGSITLTGANIDIEGKITAPSGSLSFTVNDFSQTALAVLNQSATKQTPAPIPRAAISPWAQRLP